jgi:sulfite reductase beta subunit-like hemoprotein
MPTLQPTTTINIDETVYNVADMSPSVQALIAMYDDWRSDLAKAEQTVLLHRVGIAQLQRDLVETINKEKEAAVAAAAGEAAPTTPAAE